MGVKVTQTQPPTFVDARQMMDGCWELHLSWSNGDCIAVVLRRPQFRQLANKQREKDEEDD